MATNATIIIPVYNGWEFTRACLDSVLPTLREGDAVIVANNASTDATFENLATGRPDGLRLVNLVENAGFAGACNAGAKWASTRDLVFLNNDTIVYPGWLDELTYPLRKDSVGAVGPMSNFVSGEQLIASDAAPAGEMWRVGDPADLAETAANLLRNNQGIYRDTSRLVGFCLATRASTFRLVGGFSEDYGLGGYEDDDYCRRLESARLSLQIARGCFVYHHGHATFDANGLDWKALQDEAQRVFLARWE